MSRSASFLRDLPGRIACRSAWLSSVRGALWCALPVTCSVLSACSSLAVPSMPSLPAPSLPRPYTLEIQQGVVVDQKMVSKLAPGMTRNQVGLTLGTPLLTDVLHADRWDYVYFTRKGSEVGEWRRFSCLFRNDLLVQVTGDVTVAAGSAPAALAPAADTAVSSGVPQPLPEAAGVRQ